MVNKDACMKYYDVARPLYLETDTSGIGLGPGLLQEMNDMKCQYNEILENAILCSALLASKSLKSPESHYNNTECEDLGILHELEKLCHYCFMREVCVMTDHKALVAILIKYLAMLSQ